MTTPRTGTGIALALVCLVILSTMPIISNSRPAAFGALGFAFFLSVWQTVFATPVYWFERRRAGPAATPAQARPRRAMLVLAMTSLMFAGSTYLYVLGVEKAGAANAAIAMQAYPVFAIALETLFLGRRKNAVELAFTGLLVAALYYLGTGGTGRLDGLSVWFLVALAVPFLWSIAHIIIKEELARTPITPAQVTFMRVSLSTLALGALMLVIDPGALVEAALRPDFQLFAALMGLVYYLELVVWFYAVRHIDVSLASSITTPWPAFTMVLAALVLGDRIETYQIVTFVVVAACIYGLTWAGLRKARRSELLQQ